MKPYVKKVVAAVCLCGVTAAGLWQLGTNSTAGLLLRVMDESQQQAEEILDEASSMVAQEARSESAALAAAEEAASPSDSSAASEPETDPAIEEENASTEAASSSEAASSKADSPSSAASSSKPAAPSSSSGTSSAGTSSAPSVPSSASQAASSKPSVAQNAADAQVQVNALVAQLYKVESKFEHELLQIIRQAYSEYMAYPEDQRNTFKKVTIVMGKVGEISALESECDAEVRDITDQMTTILKANNMDTSIVKEVNNTYNEKKSSLKKELVNQTYSGGDGSGTSGRWLDERADS